MCLEKIVERNLEGKRIDPTIDLEVWEIVSALDLEGRKEMMEAVTKAQGYQLVKGDLYKEIDE